MREGDMAKVRQRQKRLEIKRKEAIIDKEIKDEQILQTIRSRERILIQKRTDNLMKVNIEKSKHIVDMERWAKGGFSTSPWVKKQLDLSQSPVRELFNSARKLTNQS